MSDPDLYAKLWAGNRLRQIEHAKVQRIKEAVNTFSPPNKARPLVKPLGRIAGRKASMGATTMMLKDFRPASRITTTSPTRSPPFGVAGVLEPKTSLATAKPRPIERHKSPPSRVSSMVEPRNSALDASTQTPFTMKRQLECGVAVILLPSCGEEGTKQSTTLRVVQRVALPLSRSIAKAREDKTSAPDAVHFHLIRSNSHKANLSTRVVDAGGDKGLCRSASDSVLFSWPLLAPDADASSNFMPTPPVFATKQTPSKIVRSDIVGACAAIFVPGRDAPLRREEVSPRAQRDPPNLRCYKNSVLKVSPSDSQAELTTEAQTTCEPIECLPAPVGPGAELAHSKCAQPIAILQRSGSEESEPATIDHILSERDRSPLQRLAECCSKLELRVQALINGHPETSILSVPLNCLLSNAFERKQGVQLSPDSFLCRQVLKEGAIGNRNETASGFRAHVPGRASGKRLATLLEDQILDDFSLPIEKPPVSEIQVCNEKEVLRPWPLLDSKLSLSECELRK